MREPVVLILGPAVGEDAVRQSLPDHPQPLLARPALMRRPVPSAQNRVRVHYYYICRFSNGY